MDYESIMIKKCLSCKNSVLPMAGGICPQCKQNINHEPTQESVRRQEQEAISAKRLDLRRKEELALAAEHERTAIFALIAGLAISGVTYLAAAPGQVYIVAWGPVLFAVGRFLQAYNLRR